MDSMLNERECSSSNVKRSKMYLHKETQIVTFRPTYVMKTDSSASVFGLYKYLFAPKCSFSPL